ncbi:hypothetical protein [Micromonospora globispora]|uniref:hypothetical protein n=1 Tax=Micromonospora globispora TaxID=1450148 RepID=UPI001FAF1FD2|nr:hypothetical protein [Micromonospora globispora]
MPPPRITVQHPSRVTDVQHTDPLLYRPGHDLAGGFMLGLTDSAPMPALHQPRPAAVLPPPPGTPLTRFRCAAGDGAAAGFAVGEVHAVPGPDAANSRHNC